MADPDFLCQNRSMAGHNPLLTKKLEDNLKKDPRSKVFCSLAQIYYSSGAVEKAEKLCLEGLVYHPSHSQAYALLGDIYESQGRTQEAIYCLTQAKKFNPDNPNIYKSLGAIYKKKNDLEKTLNAYKMAVLLRPGDKEATATVQHLEKVVDRPIKEIRQTEEKEAQPKTLSEKESQKLARLNKILAHIEIYMDKFSKSGYTGSA